VATHVSVRELTRLRLISQLIQPGDVQTPADVVRRLFAVQAQDFASACWALGVRSPGSTAADVTASLSGGEIVRTWPMRGTLHFVAPEDLRWMLQLTRERMLASLASRNRQLELDAAVFEQVTDIVIEALSGGHALGRNELMRLLEDRGIRTSGERGYQLIYYLAQTATICWGPPYKNQQALVLVDEWIAPTPERSRDESLREHLLRYLAGHGPAKLTDYQWWSKLTLTDARIGLALARDQLIELEVEHETYWMTAQSHSAASSLPTTRRHNEAVYVLPGFDEYLLGYQDRSAALPAEFSGRVVPTSNGIFMPIIVSRGRAVGTWRRTLSASTVSIEAIPFVSLSSAQNSQFDRAVAGYARFLGLSRSDSAAVTLEK
jgi:hypothetical protein